ncbi:MAG: GIY-YIG nuclease family protein [candidate division Zixibacteria bacterium]
MKKEWYLYILRCADDSFYTGIALDIDARLQKHNSGKGAKYTKSRRPCELIYFEKCPPERNLAQVRERAVKKLSRAKKEELVASLARPPM